MTLNLIYIAAGLVLLVWSAGRFVTGSSALAKHLGMPPLLIGMLIVGFGTSAPEMLVSAMSAWSGNPGIALGNAFGSNICNIALILGVTALISPIPVQSAVLKKELPILTGITLVTLLFLGNGTLSRPEALILVLLFAGLVIWSVVQARTGGRDPLALEMDGALDTRTMPPGRAAFWLTAGLALLLLSSRMLVQGAVGVAQTLGVSDTLIGLTIVAVGTSLPELASSMTAARLKEHDIALGNIIGSNLFNTLAVLGGAGLIRPMAVAPEILTRDLPVMGTLTLSLFLLGWGFRGRPGRINRFEGGLLFLSYLGYLGWLILSGSRP